MKRTVKLNESDLHRIVRESVKNVLREMENTPPNDVAIGNDTLEEDVTNEGIMGDIWNGVKRGAYQMTHRPQAMQYYDREHTDNQRLKDRYNAERREKIINRREGRGAQAYKDRQIDKRLGLGRYSK